MAVQRGRPVGEAHLGCRAAHGAAAADRRASMLWRWLGETRRAGTARCRRATSAHRAWLAYALCRSERARPRCSRSYRFPRGTPIARFARPDASRSHPKRPRGRFPSMHRMVTGGFDVVSSLRKRPWHSVQGGTDRACMPKNGAGLHWSHAAEATRAQTEKRAPSDGRRALLFGSVWLIASAYLLEN